MSKTLKVSIGSFEMYSRWKCEEVEVATGGGGKGRATGNAQLKEWRIVSGPDLAKKTKTFKYSLASGAKIKSAYIYANVSASGGISSLTVNGKTFSKKKGSQMAAKVSIKSTSGTLSAVFKFRASGRIDDSTQQHSTTCKFSNVYLLIEYEAAKTTKANSVKTQKKGFEVPPQSVCIIDQTNNAIYTFDGVTKIQHSLSTDIQEEPDSKKKDVYVNNAKNEPDKVTIDVVMSDVYSVGGTDVTSKGIITKDQKNALTKAKNAIMSTSLSRSNVYFYAMHYLKEQRRKLTVITPQYVYIDMLIASVTASQDDACPFGWEGQIAFQHAYKVKAKKKKKSNKMNDDEAPPDGSGVSRIKGG